MEGLIRWFSRNHVAATFLMVGVLLAGFYTWFQLRKEIFPETSIDAVAIKVPYPNATPEDVEEGVVIPVEEAIADLDGISEINSTSAENIGVVNVEAETGYDIRPTIAIAKAVLIIMFFMHVKYGSNLTKLFAAAGFVWLVILFAFALSDFAENCG